MCLLPQTGLLLLFLRFFSALFESLAGFPHGALHTLRRLRFRGRCSHAIRRGAVMLRHFHDDMGGSLLIAETAPHRRGTHSLPTRTFVDKTARHVEFVHVERFAGILRLAL